MNQFDGEGAPISRVHIIEITEIRDKLSQLSESIIIARERRILGAGLIRKLVNCLGALSRILERDAAAGARPRSTARRLCVSDTGSYLAVKT